MSCGGCGCCPKCGCRATCTCNRNIWTLESRDNFSYSGMKPVADEFDGEYNFNGDSEFSSQDSSFSVGGENGGKCGNCDCADGTCANEGSWGANHGMRGGDCGYADE